MSKNFTDEGRKLTISATEGARAMGVSMPTFYALLQRKDSPAIRVGRKIVIPVDRFEEWLNSLAGEHLDIGGR